MRVLFFLCLSIVACGGKIDSGDGGVGPDGSPPPTKDAQPSPDVISPPAQCTPITGGSTVASDGSCTATASWSCGATQYTIDCSCPSDQCTCTQQSGSTGSGTIIKPPSLCPGCSSNLPALCGFPTN
jgi:hypothetical protein